MTIHRTLTNTLACTQSFEMHLVINAQSSIHREEAAHAPRMSLRRSPTTRGFGAVDLAIINVPGKVHEKYAVLCTAGRSTYRDAQASAQAGVTDRPGRRIEGRSAHDVRKRLRVGLDVIRRRDVAAHLGGSHHLDRPHRSFRFVSAWGTGSVGAEPSASDRRGTPCARRDHPRRISTGRAGARRTHLSTVPSDGSAGVQLERSTQ